MEMSLLLFSLAAAVPAPTATAADLDRMLVHAVCPSVQAESCDSGKSRPVRVFVNLVSVDGERRVQNYTISKLLRKVRCGNQWREFMLVGDRDIKRVDGDGTKLEGINLEAQKTADGMSLLATWGAYQKGRWLNALCGVTELDCHIKGKSWTCREPGPEEDQVPSAGERQPGNDKAK